MSPSGAVSLKVFLLVKLPGGVLVERFRLYSFYCKKCCASFDQAGRGSVMLMWRCLALVPARPLGWYVTFWVLLFFGRCNMALAKMHCSSILASGDRGIWTPSRGTGHGVPPPY